MIALFFGILTSSTPQEPHKFSETEIRLITTVANQAAIAIENTQLMVRTKIIEEELEKRKMIDRAKEILAPFLED